MDQGQCPDSLCHRRTIFHIFSEDRCRTYVRGEKGAVVIKTDADKRVCVYHISGQKMAEVRLTAGQEQTVALRPGLYIVDGIKMMVR